MTDQHDDLHRTIEEGLRSLDELYRDTGRKMRERRAKLDLALAQQKVETT